jgi:hypothetical protein
LFDLYFELRLECLVLEDPACASLFKYFLVEIVALGHGVRSYRVRFELPVLVGDPLLRTRLDLCRKTTFRPQFVIRLLRFPYLL